MHADPCPPCAEKAAMPSMPAPMMPPPVSPDAVLSSTLNVSLDGIEIRFPAVTAARDFVVMERQAKEAVQKEMGAPDEADQSDEGKEKLAEYYMALKFTYLNLVIAWVQDKCGVTLDEEQADTLNDWAGDAITKKKQRALDRSNDMSMSQRASQG